jgi:uncharacterized protein (TIGR03790 family)
MAWTIAAQAAFALEPAGVLVLVNSRSAVSKSVGEYYSVRRAIPRANVVALPMPEREEIDREVFEKEVAGPLRRVLAGRARQPRIDVLVLTKGMPLKIRGARRGMANDGASVDSELAALPLRTGAAARHDGPLHNPYYRSGEAFSSARFRMFLVTRLDGYTFADIKAMIDRGMQARDAGIVVIDAKSASLDNDGDLWLDAAARRLPPARVKADASAAVLARIQGVIAYASWGSNDSARKSRDVRLGYLPGAIVTEYVSSDGRTFAEPPAGWEITTWENRGGHFAGSPQSLTADFIRQGASGASGHVYEPFLQFTPRPDVLLPAYIVERRTLAESFWSSIPAVSWMNVVVGDPLCRLQP